MQLLKHKGKVLREHRIAALAIGGIEGRMVPQRRRGDCREGPRRNQDARMADRADELRRREVGLNGRREHLGRLRRRELHRREQLGEVGHLRSGGHQLGDGHGQRHVRARKEISLRNRISKSSFKSFKSFGTCLTHPLFRF